MKRFATFVLVVLGLVPTLAHAQARTEIEPRYAGRDTAVAVTPAAGPASDEAVAHVVSTGMPVVAYRPAEVAVLGVRTEPRELSIEELEQLLMTAPSALSTEDLRVLDVHYEREQVRQLRQIKWIVGVPIGVGAVGSAVAILTRTFSR